ncbi:MAG TPA: hypothetical protein VFK10_08890 [Burkholderiaceae bacterium]|nr:hypothetical protein [Burkholderiaceae bacterium]
MTQRRLLILAALAFGAACANDEKPTPAPATVRSAAANDVRALIGDAACQSDAQCSTIGIGAKPCGGPARYVAWSSWRTDGQALRAAAEREAEAQRQAQAVSGRVSNCMVETDPGAYCALDQGQTGVCRLRPRNASGLPSATR